MGMKSFSHNNSTLSFVELNESKKNSILFLHGNSHGHKTFSEQMNSDIFSEYRLVFVDLPGHGDSSPIDNYSLKNFAMLISALINELQLENLIIAGHSMGGHVAINTINVGTNPMGLFLFGTPPLKNPFNPEAFLPNPNASALSKLEVNHEEIVMLMDEMNYEGLHKSLAIEDFLKTDIRFRQEIFGDIINQTHADETKVLQNFFGNILFLLASNDTLVNNNYIKQEFFYQRPNLELQAIESGHSPHIEKSVEFNLILAQYCKKVFAKNLAYNDLSRVTQQREIENEQRNQQ